ncbi:MAG: Cof-type HAD-IIB family hydrolase [Clostridia bacterium]|nr:Cof-type HAD-IIB family hydrolase [Clostridia bacterium]
MEEFKLIAVDLDGTLLNSKSNVSDINLSAIKKINDKGIYFVPCSGRTLGEIPSALTQNPDIHYIIYSNGSTILDKTTGKEIYNCISKATASKVFDIICDYDLHITIRQGGNCYVEEGSVTKESIEYFNICKAHVVVLRDYAIYLKDFSSWMKTLDNIEVVSVFFHNREDLNKCRERLEKNSGLLVVSVSDYNLEIISVNAGKGKALLTLANKLGIDYKNTVAVGDSGNDIPMMKVAGTRIAVSNASEVLKPFCNLEICSNDEHAIDYILKNYIDKN